MRENDLCIERTLHCLWDDNCQVVVVAVYVLSGHTVLQQRLIGTDAAVTVINLNLEVAATEYVDLFLTLRSGQRYPLCELALNLD